MPEWSPIRQFGGYQGGAHAAAALAALHDHHGSGCRIHGRGHAAHHPVPARDETGFWGALGCSCFAFCPCWNRCDDERTARDKAEERRVGKGWVSTCKSWWSPDQ